MRACYIFDLDKTLANNDHREHHIKGEKPDWETFFALCHLDEPIPHIVQLATDLHNAGAQLVFCTGRSARAALATTRWLQFRCKLYGPLYTRADGDHRPDEIVKMELLDQIIADGYQPILVFDDRNKVVAAWRKRGIPCAQVCEGDF